MCDRDSSKVGLVRVLDLKRSMPPHPTSHLTSPPTACNHGITRNQKMGPKYFPETQLSTAVSQANLCNPQVKPASQKNTLNETNLTSERLNPTLLVEGSGCCKGRLEQNRGFDESRSHASGFRVPAAVYHNFDFDFVRFST